MSAQPIEHVDVLIVGAGISGISAACHLAVHNPKHSYLMLEGRSDIGGTWDLFRYPGIRSDSDMYTFGFAFKPWTERRDIATAEAIQRYLNETVAEYGVRAHIRFGHRVTALDWSSERQHWIVTVTRAETGDTIEIACGFVMICTGYYNYDRGYVPDFPGIESFKGQIAHPQHWPEDLAYAGKRVLVIGSGATAVTVVPAMAETAAHVTMLQRSPSYLYSRPAIDAVAVFLRKVLPGRAAHALTRLKNLLFGHYIYFISKKRPEMVKKFLRDEIVKVVGPDFDVDTHFTPHYNPWDQRLCLTPDADILVALRDGKASVVTDTIDTFTEAGVRTASGREIAADIVVPATGLQVEILSGVAMTVDGRRIEAGEIVTYKGMMGANVPNLIYTFGYSHLSWTLRADLTSHFLSRLLTHMGKHGYRSVVPALAPGAFETESAMQKLADAGYIKRAVHRIPRQGPKPPWRNNDNYFLDYMSIKWGRLNDGVLRFTQDKAKTLALPMPVKRPRFAFAGRTALITGAGSGIGRALARTLAARGCNLALVDANADTLAAVAAEVGSNRLVVSTYVLDVADPEAVARLPQQVLATHDSVDLLINNAGVALGGHFEDVTRDEFDWLMRINFGGAVNLTRAMLAHLKTRPDAHIANISSVFGLIAPPGQAAYCASKFALRGFTEALRHELADGPIGVSAVHPGGIKTNIARDARIAEAVQAASDPEQRKRELSKTEKAFITSPEKAAEIILRGIERRRARILVGPDARVIATVERLFPTANLRVLARLSPI